MDDELLERGREIQGRLWPQVRAGGGDFPAARLAPDFFRYVAASAFGMIWSRPGLAMRDRSLVTVAQLAALGRSEELRAHLAGALNVGLTRDELVEVLMQTAIYAGVPAANEALRVAADVLGGPEPPGPPDEPGPLKDGGT
ncbi:MAG TPA: carboxymuconolactone decarboxylase family protein [Acidimicrobiales bacterium]|jgi:4-carboxymuconolactone decarboxylase|nr:carboxymuconolactone decarboxylase family protein [Acidimicrobiales bacterium]